MGLDVRTAREDEREILHEMSRQAFMHSSPSYDADADRRGVPLDRRLVAEIAGTVAGKLSVWELGQWFGGRRVPMGGIAGVAVRPEFRGRQVATELLRAAIRDMRDRGEVLSSLFPMNHALYRRSGWQSGGRFPRHEAPLRAMLDLPKPRREVAFRPVTPADLPRLKEIHDEMSSREPGNLSYGEDFARRRLEVPASQSGEGYVAETDGVVTGGVTVSREEPSSEKEFYSLEIGSMVAADRDTDLAIWRLVAANHPVARIVRFVAPPERTVAHLYGEREIYQTGPNFVWMTRLVDAPGAIEARGYDDQVTAEVHLAIDDELAPWNAGNFVLRVDSGKGHLEPGGSGKVGLSAGTLASLYTGWSSPDNLGSWGLLDGADVVDIAALRRSFGGSTTPWMRDFF